MRSAAAIAGVSLFLMAGSWCPAATLDQSKVYSGNAYLPQTTNLVLGKTAIVMKGEPAALVFEIVRDATTNRWEAPLRLRLESGAEGAVLWRTIVPHPDDLPSEYVVEWDEKTQTIALVFLVGDEGKHFLFYEIEPDRASALARSGKISVEVSAWQRLFTGNRNMPVPRVRGVGRHEVWLKDLVGIPADVFSYFVQDVNVTVKEGRWGVALTLWEERKEVVEKSRELEVKKREFRKKARELEVEEVRLDDGRLKLGDEDLKKRRRELDDWWKEVYNQGDELDKQLRELANLQNAERWTTSRVHLALPIRKLDAELVFVSKGPTTNAPARPPR